MVLLREPIGALAYSHGYLSARRVLTDVRQLGESDRMDVLGLIYGDQKHESEILERLLQQQPIPWQNLICPFGIFAYKNLLKEQIDEVRKREQPCSSSDNHDFARLSQLQLNAQPLRLAQLKRGPINEGFC